MAYFVKALGIVILVMGVIAILRPATVRTMIEFAKVGKRIYIGGAMRIVIGALLLLAIPYVSLPWVCSVIGGLSVVAGIVMFAIGIQRVHAFMDWLYNMPENKLRAFQIITVIFGILLIYAA